MAVALQKPEIFPTYRFIFHTKRRKNREVFVSCFSSNEMTLNYLPATLWIYEWVCKPILSFDFGCDILPPDDTQAKAEDSVVHIFHDSCLDVMLDLGGTFPSVLVLTWQEMGFIRLSTAFRPWWTKTSVQCRNILLISIQIRIKKCSPLDWKSQLYCVSSLSSVHLLHNLFLH